MRSWGFCASGNEPEIVVHLRNLIDNVIFLLRVTLIYAMSKITQYAE
jgi:hypothetical protein